MTRLPGNCRLHHLAIRGDDRGSLIAIEGRRDVPFDVARVYYIFGTLPGVARGFHAHRALMQLAICVSGSCTMLLDDGKEKCRIALDHSSLAVEIAPMVWHEMHDFSPDCVLMVLASSYYDEADYIRNYEDFMMKVGNEVAS